MASKLEHISCTYYRIAYNELIKHIDVNELIYWTFPQNCFSMTIYMNFKNRLRIIDYIFTILSSMVYYTKILYIDYRKIHSYIIMLVYIILESNGVNKARHHFQRVFKFRFKIV